MRAVQLLGTCLLAAVTVAACDDDTVEPAPERYVLALTGAAERPTPVTTSASGSAVVTVLSPDSIQYAINITALDSITQAHFHAGDANSAGPVMVFTYGPGAAVTGRVDGAWRFAVINRATPFVGVFTFDSLLTRMRAGTTYLNVHTRKFPGGELRGQVVP